MYVYALILWRVCCRAELLWALMPAFFLQTRLAVVISLHFTKQLMVLESKTDECLFPHLQNEPVYEILEFHLFQLYFIIPY